MPRTVTLGLVQQRWHADAAEHERVLEAGVAEAALRGAQLVCLQELTLHRYFADVIDARLFSHAEPVESGRTVRLAGRLARAYGVHVVASLFERAAGERFYNTAVILAPDGRLAGFTRKQHIPRGAGYHEDHYFMPGDSNYPVHDLGFIKLAVPTCYDQWFPELARIYALNGAELLVYPTAIGSEPEFPDFDSQPRWETVMRGHAIANGVFVAAVNRTGNEGKVDFYGTSFVCDPTGVVLAQAPRHQAQVVVATLDFDTFAFWRKLFPLTEQRQPHTYGRLSRP